MNNSRFTIADVARSAGVSTATVSRVLNATAPVDRETADRVRTAVAELNYVPHAAARTLASHRTNTLGLLLPQIAGPFFQPLLRGVETAVNEAGYDLLVHTTRNPHANQVRQRPLGEHNTDGLLIFTDSVDARELTRLSRNGFPVVLLYQTPPRGIQVPVVTIENQSGARQVVNHLVEVHDRRRIVFLQGPEGHEDSLWREKGYREALKEHNIPFDKQLVARGGFHRDAARQAVERLLAGGVTFDAIFAGDDDAALGVLFCLRLAGIKVPEDVALTGFDDQVFSATIDPPLTTVRAPTEQVGRSAVQNLLALIRGGSVESRLVLPTELVIRASCGCTLHSNSRF